MQPWLSGWVAVNKKKRKKAWWKSGEPRDAVGKLLPAITLKAAT